MDVFAIILLLVWIVIIIRTWQERWTHRRTPTGGGTVDISKHQKVYESLAVTILAIGIYLVVGWAVDKAIRMNNDFAASAAASAAFQAGWQPSFSCGEHGVVREHRDTGQWQRLVPAGRWSTSWANIATPPC